MRNYQWTAITQHGTLIRFRPITSTISAENIIIAEAELEERQYMLNNLLRRFEDSEVLIGTILIRKHD